MTESPKDLFILVHKESAEAMNELAQGRTLRVATIFAMSELVSHGATKEQLDGAKQFASILLNLGAPRERIEPFPDKSIKS